MEMVCMIVVLALYGEGMYMWGYRRALARATKDMQVMESNMTKGVEHE